ncbi:MAG: peptide/nickel transport system permease protein [Thermomicrobiales bacterium]|jgi:peptide/nickel transport system permease protein|nr:peptide/nickel transport system permease protein [Thermomicrobiales bacterium]
MLAYVLRRLLWIAITLWGVSLLTFGLIFAGPADPAQALSGEKASAASIALMRSRLGLDRPVYRQYLTYMGDLVRGDLGESYYFNRPVREALLERFPATALLAVAIFVFAVAIGVPLGVVTALRNGGVLDRLLTIGGLLTISMPSFFFGILLLYCFAFRLKWFPVGGYGSLDHVVLPALTVALPWGAWYGIVLRSNMLDVLSHDYARTAAAKGLRQSTIAWRHLLPNALLSVITMLGMDFAVLLSGLALVEYIFSWPGIGWQALQAAQRFDVPMIMGSVILGALLIGSANLIVDLIYTRLDPRVRLG